MSNLKMLGVFTVGITVGVIWSEWTSKKKNDKYIQNEIDSFVKDYHNYKEKQSSPVKWEKPSDDGTVPSNILARLKYQPSDGFRSTDGLNLAVNEPAEKPFERIEGYEDKDYLAELASSFDFRSASEKANTAFPIQQEEYESDDEPSYEKSGLILYRHDGVLLDESEEPVPVPTEIIGAEVYDYLVSDEAKCEDGTVYIRNPNLEMDFELVVIDNSFRNHILGIEKDGDA